ncbi:hypothetical protein [Sorangium sp. So ce233]|uniref:hypothetical protein n=1 Tax=Sorangium sp. So ce233 TaxID=3133290 RepID=UPI003F5FCCEF
MSISGGARQQEALSAWRLADEAFEQADSRAARAEAMVRQLRARELVERWSWAERRLPDALRRWALAEGLWSWEEAVERLGHLDFVARRRFIRSNLALFPDASLPALLDLVREPQPGDGALWSPDGSTLSAIALRLDRARGREPALAAAAEGVRDPAGEAGSRARGAASAGPSAAVEPAGARLGALLFGAQGAARLSTDTGFAAVLDFAEHHATADELALLLEYARTLEGERRAALCGALLRSGEPLWGVPGFADLFSPEQRQAHLRAELAAYERPAEVPIHDTLRIAATLVEDEARREVLSLFLDEVRALGGRGRLEGLCAGAALADGALRPALLDEALAWMEACEELDEDDRVEGIAAALPMLPAARGAPLAERVLDAIAAGQVQRTVARDRLLAIPDAVWAALPEARWAPALRWVVEEGVDAPAPRSALRRGLPAPVRAALGEGAPVAPTEDGSAGRSARAEPSSPQERLRGSASAWASLPDAERAGLLPEIEAAARAILQMPDTEDGALRAALALLPESAWRAIWSARARASAWRRTIDLTDPALFAYIGSEHYLHAEAVIRLVLGLGGPAAVCDFARMLVVLR